MARSTLFSVFSKCNSSKKRRSVRRRRKVRGGQGGAADYGVKLWGYDHVADPTQGNVIKANLITGGTAPYMNTLPTMGEHVSMTDMSKQALDMQDASTKNMTTPRMETTIQSDSVLPKTGGKRRGSKRKYGHKIRNGRRTKRVY